MQSHGHLGIMWSSSYHLADENWICYYAGLGIIWVGKCFLLPFFWCFWWWTSSLDRKYWIFFWSFKGFKEISVCVFWNMLWWVWELLSIKNINVKTGYLARNWALSFSDFILLNIIKINRCWNGWKYKTILSIIKKLRNLTKRLSRLFFNKSRNQTGTSLYIYPFQKS